MRALKEEGRPLAKVTDRDIVADHATSTLDVTLTVEAGPIAGYGDTTVEGTDEVDRDFTGYMTGLKRGRHLFAGGDRRRARPAARSRRLQQRQRFRRPMNSTATATVPIGVEVSERKKRYYGIGATFSNTEGFGIEGYLGAPQPVRPRGEAAHRRLDQRHRRHQRLWQAQLQRRDHVRKAWRGRTGLEVLFESGGRGRAPRRLRPFLGKWRRRACLRSDAQPEPSRPSWASTIRTSTMRSAQPAILSSAFRCNTSMTTETTGSTRRKGGGCWPSSSRHTTR